MAGTVSIWAAHNAQRKIIAAQRRVEWFAANGPCAGCGSWIDLTLDHIDPRTKAPELRRSPHGQRRSTAQVWRWPDERRLPELAKCQALCIDCHREKTRAEHLAAKVAEHADQVARDQAVADLIKDEDPAVTAAITAILEKYGT